MASPYVSTTEAVLAQGSHYFKIRRYALIKNVELRFERFVHLIDIFICFRLTLIVGEVKTIPTMKENEKLRKMCVLQRMITLLQECLVKKC